MSQKDPNTIELEVAETIGMSEAHPGGEENPNKQEVTLTQEEVLVKIREEQVKLAGHYVKPHQKKSRWVTDEELDRVVKDSEVMARMCMVGRGDYTNAVGLAHTQINDTDPLRFFVRYESGQMNPALVIVNPVIVNTNGNLEYDIEGCLSYPEEPMIKVARFRKIKLEFQTILSGTDEKGETKYTLSPVSSMYLKDGEARIVQHEVCHLNGWNIYDKGHSAGNCEGALDKPKRKVDN